VVQECRGQSGDCNDPGCIQYRRRPNRELNLISNLNRPDGNVTGVPLFAAQLLAKQVAPLRSMLPSASLFGVLVNPNNLRRQAGADEVQDATRTVGVKTDVVNARTVTELEVGFEALSSSVGTRSFLEPGKTSLWRRHATGPLAMFIIREFVPHKINVRATAEMKRRPAWDLARTISPTIP
jgi:hypothetical protein